MNRLNGMKCYLSGPMEQVADQGKEWRITVKSRLKSYGVGVFDPCDKPISDDYGNEMGDIREMLHTAKKNRDFHKVQEVMKPICGVDLRMTHLSDFLILNVIPDIHMCGSYWEASWAAQQRKPILVHCSAGLEYIPNWLFGITPYEMMFDNWNSMFKYLSHINSDKVVDHMRRWVFFDYDKVFAGCQSIPF